MYDAEARASLLQLRRIPKGDTIEEDHQRGRALVANFVKDKTGAIEQFDRGGKTYIRVKDYQKMREGVGMLLAELMRIKAEGDYDAIKALIDKYGVHFDPKLRDRAVAQVLNLPTTGRRQPGHATLDAGNDASACGCPIRAMPRQYPVTHDDAPSLPVPPHRNSGGTMPLHPRSTLRARWTRFRGS